MAILTYEKLLKAIENVPDRADVIFKCEEFRASKCIGDVRPDARFAHPKHPVIVSLEVKRVNRQWTELFIPVEVEMPKGRRISPTVICDGYMPIHALDMDRGYIEGHAISSED